jgi:hypothetical protein
VDESGMIITQMGTNKRSEMVAILRTPYVITTRNSNNNILILSSHLKLGLRSGLFPFNFPSRILSVSKSAFYYLACGPLTPTFSVCYLNMAAICYSKPFINTNKITRHNVNRKSCCNQE